MSNLDKCQLVDLRTIHDRRGNLSVIEAGIDIPFEIRRVYYLYDVPGGAERGGHAHKNLYQLMVAMSGSFDVSLTDGINQKKFHMNRSHYGLLIYPGIWRDLDNFSTGAVNMVLASERYHESDYIRDFDNFKNYVRSSHEV